MDKYRLFDKIIKTKVCAYFRAENKETHESVVVKKLHKPTTWEELLNNKDLSTIKNSKIKNFPIVHEIVKDDDQFYIIMENLAQNLEFVIKADIEKEQIFRIGRQLIQLAIHLANKKIYPRQIRPLHLFQDQSSAFIKLTHLETMGKDISKLDLVQLQDLRYLSPEQVLTTQEIDQRSLVFSIGLLICDLIMGKSLIAANTKMNYIYQMVRLFPEDNIGGISGSQHDLKASQMNNSGDNFQKTVQKYNFSSQFVALLRQMLKMDRCERLTIEQLLDAWDVVVENERNYKINEQRLNEAAQIQNKLNSIQYPINDEIDLEFEFQFQQKATLSTLPTIKSTSQPIDVQKNVEDDVNQPIIIKQSLVTKGNAQTTKHSESLNRSGVTNFKQPSLSTIKKPQLTNYAMNQANLGVQMGINPSIFSENDV